MSELSLSYTTFVRNRKFQYEMAWGSGECWVNFQCRGVLLIWVMVGPGPTALEDGAGGVVWTFLLSSISFLTSFSLCGRQTDTD